MSTRANIIIKDSYQEQIFYRHSDGYPDGTLPDFRNIDHSFTLRITEMVNYPRGTGLNSKKTTFLETLKKEPLSS